MALNAVSRPNELGAPSRPAPYSPMPRQVGPRGGDDDPRVRPGAGSDRSQPRPPLRDRDRGLVGGAVAFELLRPPLITVGASLPSPQR